MTQVYIELIIKNRKNQVVELVEAIKNLEKSPMQFLKFTLTYFSENFDLGITPSNGAQTKAI